MFGDIIIQKKLIGIWISTRIAILRIKKELLVLEYIDRGYIVIDNNRADIPIIYKLDNRYTNTPVTQINKILC